MTPKEQARYWKAYARQNARYERYGAKLFHAALVESVRSWVKTGQIDNEPVRKAYQTFYQKVGQEHKEWEDKRWSARPGWKQKDRSDPEQQQAPGRTWPSSQDQGIVARFTMSFRNAAWLQRLRSLINGLDVAVRITNITETTRKQIQRILAAASQEEVRTGKIAQRILKEFRGKMGRKRAEMIARTETTYVANEAAKQSAEETGLELVKIWVATLDDRTRDAHRAMHGKDPVDAHEKFVVGGVRMDKPGDPAGGAANVINCRCVVAYLPKGDAEL